MAKRGHQANLSFFAFTATPKHKTLAVFGRKGEPSDRYTIFRQGNCDNIPGTLKLKPINPSALRGERPKRR